MEIISNLYKFYIKKSYFESKNIISTNLNWLIFSKNKDFVCIKSVYLTYYLHFFILIQKS